MWGGIVESVLSDRLMISQIPRRPTHDAEVWIADSGSTHHTTGDMIRVFNTRPPPSSSNTAVLGDGKVLPVLAVGSLKHRFYQSSRDRSDSNGTCFLLTNMYVLQGIRFNFFSTHQAQKSQPIMSDNDGVCGDSRS